MEANNNEVKKKKSVSEVMFDCGLLMMILSWAVSIMTALLPERK
jgi:hypothetical protein